MTFDKNENPRTTKFDIVAALLPFLVLVFFILMNIFNLWHTLNTSVIMARAWNVSWMLGLNSLIILKFYQWRKLKSFANFVKAIHEIDDKVKKPLNEKNSSYL